MAGLTLISQGDNLPHFLFILRQGAMWERCIVVEKENVRKEANSNSKLDIVQLGKTQMIRLSHGDGLVHQNAFHQQQQHQEHQCISSISTSAHQQHQCISTFAASMHQQQQRISTFATTEHSVASAHQQHHHISSIITPAASTF